MKNSNLDVLLEIEKLINENLRIELHEARQTIENQITAMVMVCIFSAICGGAVVYLLVVVKL